MAPPFSNIIPLKQAPFDTPLILQRMTPGQLTSQLEKMGLVPGSEIVRLDETLSVQTIRVRGQAGDVVLSSDMGIRTIVHLEDGRRIPLIDMEPGESGHLEGTTSGDEFVRSLEILGFKENDPITLVRKLPPMEYLARLNDQRLVRLSEGDTARILGETDGRQRQFSLSSVKTEFRITRLLGGDNAIQRLQQMGVRPGATLTLQEVRSTQQLYISGDSQLVISSHDGLHLHLPEQSGETIFVYTPG